MAQKLVAAVNSNEEKNENTNVVAVNLPEPTASSNSEYKEDEKSPFKRESTIDLLQDIKLRERAVNSEGGEKVDRQKLRVSNVIWCEDDSEQIGVWLRVIRVLEVNVEKQWIKVKIWLSLIWLDEEVCQKYGAVGTMIEKKKEKLISKTLTKTETHEIVSLPEVRFANMVDTMDVEEETCKLAADYVGENTVYWRRLITAKFCDPVSAENFPFDYEDFVFDLRLLLSRNRYLCLYRPNMWLKNHKMQVGEKYSKDAYSYICPNNDHIPEWTVCSCMNGKDLWLAKFDNEKLVRLISMVNGGRGRQTGFYAYVVLKRSSRYWVRQVWSLYVLTTYFALISFTLDPDEMLNDRMNFGAAILFLQIGLKFTVTENMPKLKYLTTLDYHIYLSILMVMLISVSQGNSSSNEPIYGTDFDTCLFYFWLAIITLSQISIFLYAKCRQRRQRNKFQERGKYFTQTEDEDPIRWKSVKLDFDKQFQKMYKKYEVAEPSSQENDLERALKICCPTFEPAGASSSATSDEAVPLMN